MDVDGTAQEHEGGGGHKEDGHEWCVCVRCTTASQPHRELCGADVVRLLKVTHREVNVNLSQLGNPALRALQNSVWLSISNACTHPHRSNHGSPTRSEGRGKAQAGQLQEWRVTPPYEGICV